MASADMKDIKRRIKSVESTMQITKAMELVASSKLRKAKEKAEKARSYFNIMYETVTSLATNNRGITSPYLQAREVKCSGYIVVAGDRGLAGGYNSNVFKLAESHMQGKNVKVIPVGNKAHDYFSKRGYNIPNSYINVAENITIDTAKTISEECINLFRTRKIDELFVIYTNFVSALSQEPALLKVFPLDMETKQDNIKSGPKELITYEPSPEAVFNNIIPKYTSGIIYGAIVESFASEQGARRTAMESATDNATEMIDELSLKYNRARQAAITQEISEIVAGAGALN